MLRRLTIGLVFGTLVAGLIVSLHYYLARRFALDLALTPALEVMIVSVITALGGSIVLLPIGERLMPPPVSRLFTIIPSVWMGMAFLLLSLTAISDLLLLGAPATLEVLRWRAVIVGAGALALGLRATWNGLKMPDVRRVEFALERWPSSMNGFKIVQISDIHIGPIRGTRFAQALTDRINALKPDLIAVTGDVVDGHVKLIGDQVAPFGQLSADHGVWFVTGNHDMYSGAGSWMARLQQLGMNVLANEHVRVGGDDGFLLAGVHDHRGGMLDPRLASDVAQALDGRTPQDAVVLLAHDPSTFKAAAKHDVDLQLSGHTHDGQIWPFRYLVRLVIPWVAGAYRAGNSQLYVSRGTGFWGPPMRLGAPAEITELTITAA